MMAGGRVSVRLLAFSSVLAVLANGDLPKELSTAVAITSTATVTITTIGDNYFNQRNVKSSEGDVSVRPYCHGVCESSYNQLQVGDTLLIPNNGSADIISGHHPDTATHHRVFIRGCDPLTATYEMRPHLVFYILCDSGPSTSNFLTVFGVEQQSASWSVTEPFNCTLDGSAKVGDVGMFFQNSKGEIFVAVTTTKGVGVCSLETGTPNFIPTPSYCPNIARLSQFDPENILVECTSSKDSQSVVQVGLFSIPGAQFGQKLPLPQYDVGQIVFSGDRLVVATWKDKTVKLANLSESNPPSATVVAKGNVDSAHIVGSGITSQLVVVAKGGVEQYDLHAVFDGKREPKTLEGSENVLTRFDDPSSPTAHVVEQCLIIPTRKGSTYEMALLSLNGDKPKAIPGVRPARFAVYPGVNVTNSTDETESKMARVDVYFAIGGAVGVVIFTVIVLSPLIVAAIFEIRKMKRNHDNNVIPIACQDAGNSSDVVNAQANGSQRPAAIRILVNRSEVEYHRMPPTPEDEPNGGEVIDIEPVEAQDPGIEQRPGWGPKEERRDGDGWECVN